MSVLDECREVCMTMLENLQKHGIYVTGDVYAHSNVPGEDIHISLRTYTAKSGCVLRYDMLHGVPEVHRRRAIVQCVREPLLRLIQEIVQDTVNV